MDRKDSHKVIVREPAVAGQFYPAQRESLLAAMREAFQGPFGPGHAPRCHAGPRRMIGLMAPHAGYPYSGAGAAWGYAAMAEDGKPEAAVILGVNHHGFGMPWATSAVDGWATPLGTMPIAHALIDELCLSFPELVVDERAHAFEHSLEVQVPFLQYLYDELPILPIALGAVSWTQIERCSEALAILGRAHDLVLIASSDLSHFVSHAEAERLDRMALTKIEAMEPSGLVQTVRQYGITMCGVLPVACMLGACKSLGARKATTLHYHTSGEITGMTREVVGYGTSIVYREI